MALRELSLAADGPRLPSPEEVARLQRVWRLYRFGLPDLAEQAEGDRECPVCGYLSAL